MRKINITEQAPIDIPPVDLEAFLRFTLERFYGKPITDVTRAQLTMHIKNYTQMLLNMGHVSQEFEHSLFYFLSLRIEVDYK